MALLFKLKVPSVGKNAKQADLLYITGKSIKLV